MKKYHRILDFNLWPEKFMFSVILISLHPFKPPFKPSIHSVIDLVWVNSFFLHIHQICLGFMQIKAIWMYVSFSQHLSTACSSKIACFVNPILGGRYFIYVSRGVCGWYKINLNRKIKGTNQFLTKLTKTHQHYKNF